MPETISLKRYAQAIFQIASEREEVGIWEKDLSYLSDTIQTVQLTKILDSPQIPSQKKHSLIRDLFEKSVNPLAINLISLLSSRNSASSIGTISTEFTRLIDLYKNVQIGNVTTATSLKDSEQKKITRILENLTKSKIRLVASTDPSIIGGLVARVGDKIIDGSIKTRIENMKRNVVEKT